MVWPTAGSVADVMAPPRLAAPPSVANPTEISRGIIGGGDSAGGGTPSRLALRCVANTATPVRSLSDAARA